jgi:tRNA pseudouridine38-40 synthase
VNAPSPERRRIAIGVEYDGTGLLGWQSQKDGPSVQGVLEAALSGVADEAVQVVGAGRTDAGVHASGQVAHFDTRALRSPRAWVLGANSALPAGVCLRWARAAPPGFHARFSALARSYSYLVINREARSALWRNRAWWVHRPLDEALMHAAGQALVGAHDFSAFRAAECQSKTARRRIERLSVTRRGEFLRLDVTADAFLHHMVRNIAGTLAAVGRGARPVAWVGDVLAGGARCRAGATAPAAGLYLVRVDYGELLPTPPVELPGPPV